MDFRQQRARNTLILVFSAIVMSLASYSFSPHFFSDDDKGSQQLDSLKQEGSFLLTSQCVACHTVDLITSQRLNKTVWTKELNKMIGWGSTFDTTKTDILIDFLSTFYNLSVPDTFNALVNVQPVLSSKELSAIRTLRGNVERGKRIYDEMCAVCHEDPQEGVIAGTVLEDNPILKDEESFWSVTLNGRNEMPSYKESISNQEVADILAWLRTAH